MNREAYIQASLANPALVTEMYEKYLADPNSVDASWQRFFGEGEEPKRVVATDDASRIHHLIDSYRTFGHLMAAVSPVATKRVTTPPELSLETLGFTQEELSRSFPTCGLAREDFLPLQQIIALLQKIYCGSIGFEFSPETASFIAQKLEKPHPPLSQREKHHILHKLNESGLFEWFMHTKFVGQKRFSLEGAETLIPVLSLLLDEAANRGMEECIIGMSHRGRINVLATILEKSYSDIFSEFEDHYIPESIEGSGDVKYHKGFSSVVATFSGKKINVTITPNPSHLESVGAVVEGEVRARQTKENDLDKQIKIVPLLVHGDGALSGQGVVYETMQFAKLAGYKTGGTIHIVVNNQIAFTTTPEDSRSTRYCTDIAKTFAAPVFHVNAEDPEACAFVATLAAEIRQQFHCDVFIDLLCYRKYGHNETDEPAFTQPIEYKEIRAKKSVRELYRDKLLQEGHLDRALAEEMEEKMKSLLHEAHSQEKRDRPPNGKEKKLFEVNTGVPATTLQEIATALAKVPANFSIHPKVLQLVEQRKAMFLQESKVDWGAAETMAFATLLAEGVPVRLSGQDSERGTFSHRHAVWMDQKEEKAFFPLQNFMPGQARFDVYNSPLSEMAVLGFEYGYSVAYPESLTLWEAQFGDFANGAQVIIDQYIAPAEQKWGQRSNIVLLLPHGYEGQGPEHSSARVERYLSLAGDENMVICNPTTPAQLFHLLRKQMKAKVQKPLILFTPKGLLRHPLCLSPFQEFVTGSFKPLLIDPADRDLPVAFCSGRIYYDLTSAKVNVQLVRLEQLYPFPVEEVRTFLQGRDKVIWVQEEPANMGPFLTVAKEFKNLSVELTYVGREGAASAATGSHHMHNVELERIIQCLK